MTNQNLINTDFEVFSKYQGDVWEIPSIPSKLVNLAVQSYESESRIREMYGGMANIEFAWFHGSSRSVDTQAFALRIVSTGSVIIAFRGTKELKDIQTDVLIKPRALKAYDLEGCYERAHVHTGFQKALDAIWKELTEFIEPVFENKASKIFVTGHSLGGALATICAARIALSAKRSSSFGALVTIGSPRVFTIRAAKRISLAIEEGNIARILRSKDPVPLFPYRPFKHISGKKQAFVGGEDGMLEVGGQSLMRKIDSLNSYLRAIEDVVGSVIVPGQRGGFSVLVSDHSSDDYLLAIQEYEKNGQQAVTDNKKGRFKDFILPIGKLFIVSFGIFQLFRSTEEIIQETPKLSNYVEETSNYFNPQFMELINEIPLWVAPLIVLALLLFFAHVYLYVRTFWLLPREKGKILRLPQKQVLREYINSRVYP